MKMNKTDKEVSESTQRSREISKYNEYKAKLEWETRQNDIRIKWLQSKKTLEELTDWAVGEEAKEKEKVQYVVDTIIEKFSLQEKKVELYQLFNLVLTVPPKIEVGNIEEKKEESLLEIEKVE
jgi:hypothetical protein